MTLVKRERTVFSAPPRLRVKNPMRHLGSIELKSGSSTMCTISNQRVSRRARWNVIATTTHAAPPHHVVASL